MSGYIGPKTSDVPIGTISTKGTVSANSIVVGNATVNSTVFTGTANNSTYAFGKTEGNLNVNSAVYANGSYTNTFTVGTGTYFITNGYVGVGNSTPLHKLSVAGTGYYTGQVNVGTNVSISTTSFYISNGTIGTTIYNNGVVIGTGRTIPSGGGITLDGNQGINNDFVANNRTAGIGLGWGVVRVMPSSLADGIKIYGDDNQTTNYFTIESKNAGANTFSPVLSVISNGNVGIGTISPAAKLDVIGPTSVTSFTGTTKLGMVIRGSNSATDYSGIDFIGNSQTNPLARIAVLSTGGGSYLSFGTSVTYASGITNQAMTIDYNGNTGIGYTSPLSRLHVANEIRVGRVDSSQEGGEIKLCRASDDAAQYSIDVYGSGSSPALRMFDAQGGTVFLNASPTGVNYIKFNPTQAASGDANALDDYEEGTWTPSIDDGTYTYGYRSGYYVKIGKMVVIHFGFYLNSATPGTATASISGIPFTITNAGGYQEFAGRATGGGGFVTATLSTGAGLHLFGAGGTTLYVRNVATNGDSPVASNNVWQAGTFIKFQMWYLATA